MNNKIVISVIKSYHLYYNQNIKHYAYPLLDNKQQNIYQYFDDAAKKISISIKNGSILIHCGAGVSRSPTLLIAYLIKCHHMTFIQALKLLKAKRPQVCPNLGFERQLKAYYENIHQKAQTQTNFNYSSKTLNDSNKKLKGNDSKTLDNISIIKDSKAEQKKSLIINTANQTIYKEVKGIKKESREADKKRKSSIKKSIGQINNSRVQIDQKKIYMRDKKKLLRQTKSELRSNTTLTPTIQKQKQKNNLKDNIINSKQVIRQLNDNKLYNNRSKESIQQFDDSKLWKQQNHYRKPFFVRAKLLRSQGFSKNLNPNSAARDIEYLKKMAQFRFGLTNTEKWLK